ncbi:DNA polymerase III subunit chi [Pelomicrobium methylotrophicum]|uniref:DNA polymerase III subunit chi n=1 Tax=Pelomicrobium methylotrophicum TaxID=2602750 RepID=A0A5C7EL68_9PROT|nr:DNA polymerase III subunit chi [Pelomicrobium methylotrophicum]TXF12096.1 DNA polymerase III subunit chi [Pelomicrobium methylotrophicum]
MTQIDFYTRADDKLATACRLAAKAFQQGLRVLVLTPDAEITERVDRLLWTTPSTGFIPHCRNASPLAEVTPVIVDHEAEPLRHDEVLINLRRERPAFFSRFQRLVEIVSMDETDSQAARERYRFYQRRGYAIRHHDLSALRGRA